MKKEIPELYIEKPSWMHVDYTYGGGKTYYDFSDSHVYWRGQNLGTLAEIKNNMERVEKINQYLENNREYIPCEVLINLKNIMDKGREDD